MYLLKLLLAVWAVLVHVALADTTVAFTKWPNTVYTGKPANVYWTSNSNAPATITLRKGSSDNLQNVKVLTTQATGGVFTWVPDDSLPDASDYALQIDQDGSINYTGLLTLAHEPGKESPPVSSKSIPSASGTSPLGGVITSVAKGNNGQVPSSSAFNVTSTKSTTSKNFTGDASLAYISLELIFGAIAGMVYYIV